MLGVSEDGKAENAAFCSCWPARGTKEKWWMTVGSFVLLPLE